MRNIPRDRRSRPLSGHRPAQPEFRRRSRTGRAVRDQRRRRSGRDPDRGGRQRRQPGAAGRTALRPGRALSGARTATPRTPSRNIRLLAPTGERVSLAAALQSRSPRRRVRNLPRRTILATWPSSTASAAATWAARWKKPWRKVNAQVKLPAGYHLDWAGEYESAEALAAPADDRAAADHPGDLHDPLHHVQLRRNGPC